MILLNDQSELRNDGSYSLFIRHAHRYPIPAGEFGNDVELNEIGFDSSILLGESLRKLHVNAIYSSPVLRCVQTAESILKGLDKEIPIQKSFLLGDPGAFVHAVYLAGQSYLKLGFERCYFDFINHQSVEGNIYINEGSDILTTFLKNNAAKESINIYISHDMIVALYSFAAFQRLYLPGENWVQYLNGLLIKHL